TRLKPVHVRKFSYGLKFRKHFTAREQELSETDIKQELVSCLVNKSKRRTGGNELKGPNTGTRKGKEPFLEERSTWFENYYSSGIEDEFRYVGKRDSSIVQAFFMED
ncbi:24514_t:CDS:2, partial [Cetraspora pellucida]